MNETLSKGKYFLGDTSLLPTKILIGIWGDIHNFRNGKYNVHNYEFVAHNTHGGDGIFQDTKNRSYNISSGFMGLININLIENIDECKNTGHIFNFDKNINFIYDAGLFYIKSGKKYIQIDTRNLEFYDSDNEEHCFDEENEPISKTICGAEDDDSIQDENDNLFDSDNECEENMKPNLEINNEKRVFFKKRN
jgi:hypothetical protein